MTCARALLLALSICGVLAGCGRRTPAPVAAPHYVVGAPYQAGGVWRYPREEFALEETGLAVVYAGVHAKLTADGEVFDQTALAAGHPSLQLPALARITDLETGRQILVRINDRGPDDPGRAVVVTARAAQLLGAPRNAPFRMRLQVQEAESRQLAATLDANDLRLPVAAAPRGGVAAESLAPPPGARQAGQVRTARAGPAPAAEAATAAASPVPLRLPEAVLAGAQMPGSLYVFLGAFGGLRYAEIMRARMAGLGAQTSTLYAAPRDQAYRVTIGPLPDVPSADAVLAQAIRGGVPGARIIVQ